jgi:O-antigen ligase
LQPMATRDMQSILTTAPADRAGDGEGVARSGQPMARERSSLLSRCSMALVLFVLATMPVLFGAMQAWVWSLYTVAMYAAFALLLPGVGRGAVRLPAAGDGSLAVGVFLTATLLGCVPLPPGLLAWLSPVRHDLLRLVAETAGTAPVSWTISYAPLYSLAWWAFLLGLALLFGVMRTHFADSGFLKTTLWVLFGLAVLEAFYGILQALVPNLGVLWISYMKAGMGDARGTYISRNHFAGLMEMLLPLLLGFGLSRVAWNGRPRLIVLLHSERLHQHMMVILGLVIIALALLFSKSRGGISGGILGLGVFSLLMRGGQHKLPPGVRVALGLFLTLTLFYGLRIGFEPIIERFLSLEQGDSRLNFWRDSLAMIADHPLGIGLASFKTVFPVYHVSAVSDATTPYYLHNDVLQLLAEAGWAGLISLGGAFAVFMIHHFRRIRRMDPADDPQRFFLAAGAYGGLAALGFHSLMDFNLQIPANAAVFVMLLAMVRTLAQETDS